MTEKEYLPLTKEEIEQAFQSGNLIEMSRTLLALALHDPDWRRTEDYCLQFLEHANAGMRGFAAECISHLIYNQHHLDVDLARSALYRHQSDPNKYVARKVKYALSDIEVFENTPV